MYIHGQQLETLAGSPMGRLKSMLAPLRYKALRALRFPPQELAQVAVRRWELSPAVEEQVEPIAMPEGHLQKILGGASFQPPDKIRADFTATRELHMATEAFLLRNVSLVGAFCYCGRHKTDLWAPGQLPARSPEAAESGQIDRCVLGGSHAGSRWFGHMLHDDLPLHLAASTLGDVILHARRAYPDEPGWREAFGLPIPPRFHRLFIREMIMLRDVSQNRYKQERLRALRQKLSGRPKSPNRRLYIRRGAGGAKRVLLNEAELVALFERHLGFAAVSLDGRSVPEIIDLCNGADLVVSVEGSHAVPPMFTMLEGGKVVFLSPPNRVSPTMPKIFRSVAIRCGMFIGDASGEGREEFTADPIEVLRFVEKFAIAK
jgi:hypothetical protein